jgi:hypothetical protein
MIPVVPAAGRQLQVLDEFEWQTRRQLHESRVDVWINPRLQRMSLSQKHPVYDFLFDYYSFRPGQLRRWHPGIGVGLSGLAAEEYLSVPTYRRSTDGAVFAEAADWKPKRRVFVRWLGNLLQATANRPGFYGCHGLHEWAMVYRAPTPRHQEWPLRLGRTGTDAVVESAAICCSHYDAFRFFTPGAVPRNRLQLTRSEAPKNEQPGCLHANMDLYKWAYKLTPFAPSELIADAFALALKIREIDMRASPYDFSSMGFVPIAIETPEGRAEYERHQRQFAAAAVPIRLRLQQVCETLIETYGGDEKL